MTKKRSSEIFAAKMEIFVRKKRHLGRRKYSVPQTRRQVSATADTPGDKLFLLYIRIFPNMGDKTHAFSIHDAKN